MKYSISGTFNTNAEMDIINVINQYFIYNLKSQKITDELENVSFNFEVWLPNMGDKNNLYNQLKLKIDELGGSISWHECTHDEENAQPCVIIESHSK